MSLSEKVKNIMVRVDLLQRINLHSLERLARELNIDTDRVVWLDFIDMIMDVKSSLSVLTIADTCSKLVHSLDHCQLVRLRYFFHCLESSSCSGGGREDTTKPDSLEQIYLRSLTERKSKNYNSSVTLNFGRDATVFTMDSMHSPDYFINMKLYELNRSTLQPAASVKFYGSQLFESDIFKMSRHLTMQAINIIERRHIEDEQKQ